MQRSTVVRLGEAFALVPALPTAGTVPDPGAAHLPGAEADVAARPSGAMGDALLDAPARDWAITAGPGGFAGPVTVGAGAGRP